MGIETISITNALNSKKPQPGEFKFGMIIRIRSKTCLLTKNDSEYPVLLTALDNFEYYEEFKDFTEMVQATNDVKIIGQLKL